jgi:hypothetical protein
MKSKNTKKSYQAPKVEQIQLDTEISLVMTSPPNDPWSSSPQNPNNLPGGFIQKIFKFGA